MQPRSRIKPHSQGSDKPVVEAAGDIIEVAGQLAAKRPELPAQHRIAVVVSNHSDTSNVIGMHVIAVAVPDEARQNPLGKAVSGRGHSGRLANAVESIPRKRGNGAVIASQHSSGHVIGVGHIHRPGPLHPDQPVLIVQKTG